MLDFNEEPLGSDDWKLFQISLSLHFLHSCLLKNEHKSGDHMPGMAPACPRPWTHVIGYRHPSTFQSLDNNYVITHWSWAWQHISHIQLQTNRTLSGAASSPENAPFLYKRKGNQWYCTGAAHPPWQQTRPWGCVSGGWLCMWRGAYGAESCSWSSEALVVDTECAEAGTAECLHGSQGSSDIQRGWLLLPSQEQFSTSHEVTLLVTTGTFWAEAREAAKHPAMHRTAPTTKNDPAQMSPVGCHHLSNSWTLKGSAFLSQSEWSDSTSHMGVCNIIHNKFFRQWDTVITTPWK